MVPLYDTLTSYTSAERKMQAVMPPTASSSSGTNGRRAPQAEFASNCISTPVRNALGGLDNVDTVAVVTSLGCRCASRLKPCDWRRLFA